MRFYCRRCKTSYQHREVRGAKEPGPRSAACVGDRDLGSWGRLGGQAWGPRAQGCVRRRPPRGGMLKAGFSVARSLRAGPATPSASPSRPCPRPPLSARSPGGTRPSLSRPSPEQVRPPFRASGRSPENARGAARRGAGSGSSAARIARVPAILSPRSPFVRELCLRPAGRAAASRPGLPRCPVWVPTDHN